MNTEPPSAATQRIHRQGPRPLPLYLATATTSWIGSRAAFTLWRNDSLPWRPDLRPAAERLRAELESRENDPPGSIDRTRNRWNEVEIALTREIVARSNDLLKGILAYRDHPYRRHMPAQPSIWSAGNAQLLDYDPGGTGRPLLIVPSLINRHYVLDLAPERSLTRYLAEQGYRPFLMDWGRPGTIERNFNLTDYVTSHLEDALDAVLAEAGQPPVLIGYCMGGLLTLALAQRRREDISALVLMATPWDFSADGEMAQAAIGSARPGLSSTMDLVGELPTDAIQGLFHALDPMLVIRKFLKFAAMDPTSEEGILFVALEDWLNDGVPLTAAVAREALFEWYLENTPARRRWRVGERTVDPAEIDLPALVMVPARDRIVPPESALALAEALPRAERLRTPLGHIGMVVGGRARDKVWTPLKNWLEKKE